MQTRDQQIITHLRSNSRLSLTRLSHETGIPISTIFEKLQRNEGQIIKRHTCLIDFAKAGYNTLVKILLKSDLAHKENLREFLIRSTSLNSVFKINNGFDFMVEGIFDNVGEVDNFIEELESRFKVKKIKTFFIVEELKREAFMMGQEHPFFG